MGYTRRTLLAGLGLAGLQTMMPSLVKKAGAMHSVPVVTGRNQCHSMHVQVSRHQRRNYAGL